MSSAKTAVPLSYAKNYGISLGVLLIVVSPLAVKDPVKENGKKTVVSQYLILILLLKRIFVIFY